MNFNKGDRVKFLDDVGKGTIIGLIDKDMVLVLTDDGFEYPVLQKELIITDQLPVPGKLAEPAAKTNTVKKNETLRNVPVNQKDSEKKEGSFLVYLGVQPTNSNMPGQGKYALHLINDSTFQILFHAAKGSENIVDTLKSGYLEPEMKIVLGDYSLSELVDDKNVIYFQLIHYRNTGYTRKEPISARIRFNSNDLKAAGSFKKNKFLQGNALIIPIEQSVSRKTAMSLEDFKNAMVSEKSSNKDSLKSQLPPKTDHKKVDFQEIDLHIEQITDKFKSLSSGEIIEIQLARFKTSLAGAILANEKRIVFIHGIGAGKLKSEIRKNIDKDYPSCIYQDASFKEYGYGATMIIIK
jgi:hypothetical protein